MVGRGFIPGTEASKTRKAFRPSGMPSISYAAPANL